MTYEEVQRALMAEFGLMEMPHVLPCPYLTTCKVCGVHIGNENGLTLRTAAGERSICAGRASCRRRNMQKKHDREAAVVSMYEPVKEEG